MAALLIPQAGGAEFQKLADFEGGTSGFSGNIEFDSSEKQSGKGSGVIRSDPGEPWVETSRALAEPHRLETLKFQIKSAEANTLAVRIVDSTGQSHQVRCPFPNDNAWHPVTVSFFEQGVGHESWGGAGDGQVHWPAKSLAFILEKGAMGPNAGALHLDEIEALFSTQRLVAPLQIKQAQLGNVFTTAEPVEIPVESHADEIAWSVTNYWREPVTSGVEPVKDSVAVIRPRLGPGYFEMHVEARKAGEPLASAATTLAIIAPADPAQTSASPFGVMTHFAQGWDTDIMSLIRKAGIGIIRDELYWKTVEKEKGRYDFSGRYDDYMAEAKRQGLRTLIVLSFENPLYDEGRTPYTDAGRLAYAKYGQAILDHYGDQIPWLEVWNEYNGTWCDGPAREDRPKFYAEMLKTVYSGIKARNPQVQILGGAAVLLPPPYFESLFQHGALSSMDGVVIHPYRGSPEGVDEEIEELKTLMQKYGGEKPIWVTETGSWDKGPGGRDRVAAYLVKIYTLLLTQTDAPICWYLIRDYADFFSMGLLRDAQAPEGRYAPAPSYVAYANLIQQLSRAKFVRREEAGGRSRIYRFQKGGDEIRCCWATVPLHTTWRAGGPVEVVDLMGGSRILTPHDGRVYLTLSDTPLFLKGRASPTTEAPRLTVEPVQTSDLGAGPTVRFTLDHSGASTNSSATFQIEGQSATVTAAPGENKAAALSLEDKDSGPSGNRRYRYEGRIEGKLSALGEVEVNLVDPIQISEPVFLRADLVRITISNRSAETAYPIERIAWKSGETSATLAPGVTVPPSHARDVDLPVPAQTPYQNLSATIQVTFPGRPSANWQGVTSFNPITTRHPACDGELSDWEDTPALPLGPAGGQAWLAADDQALYVAAKTPSDAPLSFGVATDGTGANWNEFTVDRASETLRRTIGGNSDGAETVDSAKVVVTNTSGTANSEIILPWKEAGSPIPENGLLRVSIASADAGWGGGILCGKAPVEYRLCTLEKSSGPPPPRLSPLPPAGHAAPPRDLLADSDEEFSNTQEKNGWSYGVIDGGTEGSGNHRPPLGPYTDDNFRPASHEQTMWGYEWRTGAPNVKIDRKGAHPGAQGGRPIWVVRRWINPVAQKIRLTGHVKRESPDGDGTGVKVLVDGVVVFSGLAAGAEADRELAFDTVVFAPQGALIDFAITPGPETHIDFDAVSTSFRVWKAP